MMKVYIAMTAKKQKKIVILCKGTTEPHRALFLEWNGELDTVTQLCASEWGSGVLRRITGMFYAWKKDEEKE